MSANKKPTLRLVHGGIEIQRPSAIDPQAIAQRITRARAAPKEEERHLAQLLVLHDAEIMLATLGRLGAEVLRLRKQVEILAKQNSDLQTINLLLLHAAGDEVRVDSEWFAKWEPTGGYQVHEEDGMVVVSFVDTPEGDGVPSESASQQTEDD